MDAKKFWISLVLCLASLIVFAQEPYIVSDLLYSETFDDSMSNWTSEIQNNDGTVSIQDSMLVVDVNAGCSVWFHEKLTGNYQITYSGTVTPVPSDFNQFWNMLNANGSSPVGQRSGRFGEYGNMNGYYVGFGANDNATTRCRRYDASLGKPPWQQPTIPGGDKTSPVIVTNKAHAIKIISYLGMLQFFIDSVKIFEYQDPNPYVEGYFAFRTTGSNGPGHKMKYDNFQVHRLIDNPTGIENTEMGATSFQLMQNYPNPFNPETTIDFSLSFASDVNIQIFDSRGQMINTLASGPFSSGQHSVIWDASPYPTGIYFYKISADLFYDMKKCMLVK